MNPSTTNIEVWKKKEDDSFFTETTEVPTTEFQGAYFFFNPIGDPSLVLHDGRIVVIKPDGCGSSVLFYDEDARNES